VLSVSWKRGSADTVPDFQGKRSGPHLLRLLVLVPRMVSNMSADSPDLPYALLTRYYRISTLLDKSDCDLPGVLTELEQDFASLPPAHVPGLINRYLPGFVKSLLDRRYIYFYQSQMRIYAFLKRAADFVIGKMSVETPGALEVIRRLLNDEKEFYNYKYSTVSIEVANALLESVQLDQQETQPEFAPLQASVAVNMFYPCILNHFGYSGGFQALLRLIESRPSLDQVNRVLFILLQVHIYLHPSIWRSLVQNYLSAAMQFVLSATDEDLRGFAKEGLRLLMSYLDSLEADVRLSEHGGDIEAFELESGLKFLESPYLDKRMLGLTGIIQVIERSQREKEEGKRTQTRRVAINPVAGDIEMTTFSSKSGNYQRRWLSAAAVLAWCDQHDLISIIFGYKSHPELVRRSGEVVRFLYKHGRCTRTDLDRIWTLALAKHEAERDVTVALYREIVPVLNPADSEHFFSMVVGIPLMQVDSQVLGLIVTFVKPPVGFGKQEKATKFLKITLPKPVSDLNNAIVEESPQARLADPSKPIVLGYFPEETQTREEEMEPEAERLELDPQAAIALELLWNWSQPQSIARGLKRETAAEALKHFLELLRTSAKQERWKYMEKCLAHLRENRDAVPMCQVVQTIISSYSIYRGSSYADETRAQVISRLDSECHLFTWLYNNIVWLKRESAYRLLEMIQGEEGLEDDERTDTQSSSSADSWEVEHYSQAVLRLRLGEEGERTYYEEVGKRLEFVKFLYQNYQESMSVRHFNLLWNCFVVNAFSQREQDDFFIWFSGLLPSWSSDYSVLDDETIHTVFTDILLRLDSKGLTLAAFECFEQYFLHVNKLHGLVEKLEFGDELEVKDMALLGIDALWDHILSVHSDKVSSQAAQLLKRLYRGTISADTSVQADLLIRCMYQVKAGTERLREGFEAESVTRISRALSLLSDFIEEFEGGNDAGPSVHLTLQNTTHSAKEPKILSIKLPIRMKLQEAREIIASKLIPSKLPHEILILHSGNNLDFRKANRSLKELKVLDSHKLIICDSADQYDYATLPPQAEEVPMDATKAEQVSQLKAICEKREEVVLAALKRTMWNMEEAVEMLMNDEILAEIEKELRNSEQPEKSEANNRLSQVLSDNRDHFDLLFQLLSLGNNTVSAKVWKLLTQIPINKDIHESLRSFSEGWEDLLDQNCLYKLLYSLQIITSFLSSATIDSSQQHWKSAFISQGGFFRLYTILMSSSHISLFSGEQQLNNAKCMGVLLSVISAFLKSALDADADIPTTLQNAIISVVEWGKLTTKLADLIEDLSQTGAEGELICVIENALGLLLPVTVHQPEVLIELYARAGFCKTMLAALLSSSEKLRKAYIDTLIAICAGLNEDLRVDFEPPAAFFLRLLLETLPKEADSGTDFFDFAAQLIRIQHYTSLPLLSSLIQFLSDRPIIEDRRAQNQDTALSGVLTMVEALLEEQSPLAIEEFAGLAACLSSSLFDTPKISEISLSAIPPKFKHVDTRRRAFALLLCVSRRSPALSTQLLQQLHSLHCTTDYQSVYDSAIPIKSSSGFVGLKNLGSTCYMNSLLQQLFLMPEFREGILAAELQSEDRLDESVLYQLQLIFANLKLSEKQYFAPRGLVKALRDMEGQALNPSVQQDVDEFFSLLCDRLETSMKGTAQERLLRNLMGGTVVNIIESTETEHPYTSEREEQFLRLSLEIKNKKTLSEALDLFIREDTLEGDNKYFCEQYDRKVNASRRVLLDSLGNTVLIHLKRFEFDYTTSQRVKVNDYCEFPVELNLQPWARDRSRPATYYNYHLVGVLVHTGIAEAGHYFSFAMDRETGQWFEFNDQAVKTFRAEDIKEECFGGTGTTKTYWGSQSYVRSGNAYLLVYERVHKEPISEETDQKTGFSLSKDIMDAVTSDNIDFLRDGQFFDQTYHRFLLSFVRQFQEGFDYLPCLSADKAVANLEEEPEKEVDLVVDSVVDSGLKVIQTAVHYALELLLRAKLTDFFKEWVKLLETLVKQHNYAAFWLLKKLTPSNFRNSEVARILLEERQAECRAVFADLLVQLVLHTLECEVPVFADIVKVLVSAAPTSSKDEVIQKSATARFLFFFLSELLTEAKRNWRRFRDYFRAVDQLIASSHHILRFSQGINLPSKLLEFYMNGNPPFVLDERLVMGDHVDSLDMEMPIEIFVTLVTQSVTTDMRAKEDYPKTIGKDLVSLAEQTERHLRDYRILHALLTHYRPEPIQKLVSHICYASQVFSACVIEELFGLLNSNRMKWGYLAHLLRYLTCLLYLPDSYEEDRIRLVMTTPFTRTPSQHLSSNLFDILYRSKDTCEMFTSIVIIWFGDMLGRNTFHTVALGFRQQYLWISDYIQRFDARNLSQSTVEDYRGATVHIPTALRRVKDVIAGLQEESSEETQKVEGW